MNDRGDTINKGKNRALIRKLGMRSMWEPCARNSCEKQIDLEKRLEALYTPVWKRVSDARHRVSPPGY
jgi:hypothetical protein